jgi:hypothetical protein
MEREPLPVISEDERRSVEAETPFVHVDAAFSGGFGHAEDGVPCQDYAASGFSESRETALFAALSDGCSSSPFTDVGSRLLCLSALSELGRRHRAPASEIASGSVELAASMASRLGLSMRSLEGTLCFVRAFGDLAEAFVGGDGLMVFSGGNASVVVSVDWAGNMPLYPIYGLSENALSSFASKSSSFAASEGRGELRVAVEALSSSGERSSLFLEEFSVADGASGISLTWLSDGTCLLSGCEVPRLSGFFGDGFPEVLSVFSDGAVDFRSHDGSAFSPSASVLELTRFPSSRTGAFAERRLRKALSRLASAGVRPRDDVSLAVLSRSTASSDAS